MSNNKTIKTQSLSECSAKFCDDVIKEMESPEKIDTTQQSDSKLIFTASFNQVTDESPPKQLTVSYQMLFKSYEEKVDLREHH